jgi:hypothetical protein
MENFFALMKRGIYGIHHQISYKHLQVYCDEFAYRCNSCKMADGRRFELTLAGVEARSTNKRLVYGKVKETSQK